VVLSLVFSSVSFLFIFLPITLLLYIIVGNKLRNFVLFCASIFFYAWGEGPYVLIMMLSIVINFFAGILIDSAAKKEKKKVFIVGSIVINLSLLIFFKYTNWIATLIAGICPSFHSVVFQSSKIHLPIGISFFTFQAISYIVDVYRGHCLPQKKLLNLGLYIACFPQLVAGPIIRYNDVAQQILHRKHSFQLFASGVERFVYGLSKKVLIANPIAIVADSVFVPGYHNLAPETAWLGIICYTLQIYFDFSGYSDMAIGLGRMFGFNFQENFNYPYIACSIQDFWRRWHISLSEWFRDYLYITLGGNRIGSKRTYLNLVIVFFLCGLWHGASWNFVIWGLLHGFFLILERTHFSEWIKKRGKVFSYFYAMFIVVNSWVFFRVETFSDAIEYLKAMYFLSDKTFLNPLVYTKIDTLFTFSLILGLILTTPIFTYLSGKFANISSGFADKFGLILFSTAKAVMIFLLLYLSISFLAVSAYNPFIYFRF
jgi:alginate O-acetyltransferase complex protein AlgI